jgi:GNAT superfamily N-acetyltransferase
VLNLFAALDDRPPHEAHYYLPIVGTKPEEQGRGIGSALLAPVLERCDREGLPAYLEATSERNKPLYARHGFTVTDEIQVPGGPTLWAMWREPRQPR